MLATRARAGGGARALVLGASSMRPTLPATAVPDELVAQAQAVLLGKPREAIVKELQRTNLNVNEAVNNLLSRDDDEDDDDAYGEHDFILPEGELLQLIDSGLLRHLTRTGDGGAASSGSGSLHVLASAEHDDMTSHIEMSLIDALTNSRRSQEGMLCVHTIFNMSLQIVAAGVTRRR
jgi:hypothetical protein